MPGGNRRAGERAAGRFRAGGGGCRGGARSASRGEVTLRTLSGVLAIYLLIGMLFSFLQGATAALESQPFFAGDPGPQRSDFLYFSYVTLSTTGSGDLAPATDLGRLLAVHRISDRPDLPGHRRRLDRREPAPGRRRASRKPTPEPSRNEMAMTTISGVDQVPNTQLTPTSSMLRTAKRTPSPTSATSETVRTCSRREICRLLVSTGWSRSAMSWHDNHLTHSRGDTDGQSRSNRL